MDSLCTFNVCLHPAPINSRILLSTVDIQSRRCLNFSERASYLKAGSMKQLWLVESDGGPRKRSISQIIKASETEASVQNESSQADVKESEEVAQESESVAGEQTTAAEASKGLEKGEAIAKYWVLRSVGEGGGRSQEIIPGDGIIVGAAPNLTGSTKPFVVDIPMVSSSHARVYGKDKSSYQKTVREYFVMDLGSTNGTYLNRSKLRPHTEVKLSHGDSLKFGDEKATFVVEAQE